LGFVYVFEVRHNVLCAGLRDKECYSILIAEVATCTDSLLLDESP